MEIDERAAAVIAAGMRAVAEADGDVHPRERAMIEALAEGLPEVDPTQPLPSAELRALYVDSLARVALADGRISEVEGARLAELAAAQGIVGEDLDARLRAARLEWFSVFAGVRHFREDAIAVGRELGLSEDEIAATLDE
jgi:uncharacterized tellurite resistance protein B-like protein